ncbi:uncharacterized protein, partial [Amphiura filiformis]|uniref:uncharacterized protein n=1 Tax=Amphiura filiformis TaxID=82378 RepID=UPI003B2161F0
LLVLICVIGAISLVALVLAAFSISQKGTTNFNVGTTSGTTGTTNEDKIWTFAIGHDGTNLEYIEDTTGTLRGFHVDIVNAVCTIANKNCRLVWDIYRNCWTSQAGERARGGLGMMSGWYDACTGWFNTYDRALTVDFTTAFRKPLMGVFYVKNGNPDGFQWTDLTGKQIGILDGWAQDEHCLARKSDIITGVPLETSQIVHYVTIEAGVAAVNNGDVAALFANTNQDSRGLQVVSDELSCTKDGGCMMFRKDARIAAWWNPAFERLKETTYRDICARVDKDHGAQPGAGGDIICVD